MSELHIVQPYFRRHAVPMLLAAVASSVITALAIFALQSRGVGSAGDAKQMQAAFLGKWELIEPLDLGVEPGDEWFDVRPDGTIQWASTSTVAENGKLASKFVQLRTHSYEVKDGSHFLLNPGGAGIEHLMKVVFVDDGLTLIKQGGHAERYRRAKSEPK